MNRPCLNCGRIITIPDIPLPKGYTQRCPSCGYDNPISDEDDIPAAASNMELWDTMDSTASGIFPTLSASEEKTTSEQLKKEIASDFEQKLRDLENRMRGDLAEAQPHNQTESAYRRALHQHIKENTVLVSAQNASVLQNCERMLGQSGFHVQTANTLETTLNLMIKTPFHIMVFEQNFLKSGNMGKQILRYIKKTPLHLRRCQVTVLITPNIPTGEPQVFYQWGIDFNINPKDMGQLNNRIQAMLRLKHDLLAPYLSEFGQAS